MTGDAARVVPELIRQAVAELKTKLMLESPPRMPSR